MFLSDQQLKMSTQPERNHNSCDFFDEDIVYRLNNKGQIEVGIVVESCENASSSDDDSDTESGEAKKKLKRLKPGTTGVSWYPRGNFENLPEKKVKFTNQWISSSIIYCRLSFKSVNV